MENFILVFTIPDLWLLCKIRVIHIALLIGWGEIALLIDWGKIKVLYIEHLERNNCVQLTGNQFLHFSFQLPALMISYLSLSLTLPITEKYTSVLSHSSLLTNFSVFVSVPHGMFSPIDRPYIVHSLTFWLTFSKWVRKEWQGGEKKKSHRIVSDH